MKTHSTHRMMNRRGSVALLTAAGLFSVMGLAGVAVDATRVWMVRTRLKTATDAAALVAARQFDESTRAADATAAFYANFNPGYRAGQPASARQTYLGATAQAPTVAPWAQSTIKVSAKADVPLTLLKVLRTAPVTVAESSTAGRAGVGLELALVIDTTWSMAFTAASGKTKLAEAQSAVSTMLDALYGSNNDTQPNLWVSVVPFTTAINVGSGYTGWLNSGTYTYPSGQSWTGCVEMRRSGEDITETNPGSAAGKFYRYYWPTTYRQNGQASASKCSVADAYTTTGTYCRGNNDWGATTTELATNPIIAGYGSQGASFGPNIWCPASSIQPLTASKATVKGIVNGLQTKFGFGTVVPAGLQGGWFTLSDQWQGYWANPNPVGGPALPTTYGTKNVQKAVVLLSDGDNNWYNARTMKSYAPYLGTSMLTMTAPENQRTELFYSGYGRLAPTNAPSPENRLGVTIANTGTSSTALSSDYNTTQPKADAKLDERTKALCDAMKAKSIQIYVIGFEVTAGSDQEKLLQYCASPTGSNTTDLTKRLYYEAPTAAELKDIFTKIAGRLATPRLID